MTVTLNKYLCKLYIEAPAGVQFVLLSGVVSLVIGFLSILWLYGIPFKNCVSQAVKINSWYWKLILEDQKMF